MAHIEWNKAFRAVEVDSISSGHFLISSLPTMIGTLEEAVTFCNRNRGWKLPGRKEAAAMAKHRRRINACLKANGRPQIYRRSMLWTDEYPWLAELRGYPVLCIFMSTGSFFEEPASDRNEFRLIWPIR